MSFKSEESDDEHAWQDLLPDEAHEAEPESTNPTPRLAQPRKRRLRKAPSAVFARHRTPVVYDRQEIPTQWVAQQPSPVYQPLQAPIEQPKPTHRPQRPYWVDRLGNEWMDKAFEGVKFTFEYALDILRRALGLLRIPLSILVVLWLLAIATTRVQHAMRAAFSPLCLVPGISSLAICTPEAPNVPPSAVPTKRLRHADYPKMVDLQSKTFEQLLDPSSIAGSSSLAINIKKSESATRDLATLVTYSNMKSKDSVVQVLRAFIGDAKATGRSLSKLNSKIGGAVDAITAVNDYALHSIEEAYANGQPSFFNALVPWSNKPNTKEVVTRTFTQAMEVLSNQLRRLIVEAELARVNLEKLEEDLNTLHDILAREDASISTAKAQLLADLWTQLGRNKARIQQQDHNLLLLKDLGKYRDNALQIVMSALHTLRSLSDDLDELGERVATPELIGADIPVAVQIKSIKGGLERIREERIKARERETSVIEGFQKDMEANDFL
ncbi:hypothetical protein ONZ45_g10860 [Pleurotus djamor]|nr:hypothetical protein ONZ45_g10860 [Pleurotus djamor]